jgi:hypothetical protein
MLKAIVSFLPTRRAEMFRAVGSATRAVVFRRLRVRAPLFTHALQFVS